MLQHVVQQGECLSSIAYQFGFADWRTIYDDPSNADFKAKRPNPNLIYPGDLLNIPDKEPHQEGVPVDARHKFKTKFKPTFLNLRLQDSGDQPVANAKYLLQIEQLAFRDQTDGDGWIKQEIPAWAQTGKLTLWVNPKDARDVVKWDLLLGHLDPLDTVTGVKARLNNLDYDAGEGEEDDEQYLAAVKEFQDDHKVQEEGFGAATKAKLQEEHGV